jgi:hypothetical protein
MGMVIACRKLPEWPIRGHQSVRRHQLMMLRVPSVVTAALGPQAAVAVATADFRSSNRKRSSRVALHPSRCPPSPSVPELPRQHSQRCHQDPLGLLLAYRPATPALPHRPLAHTPLQPDNMPEARTGGAGEPPRASYPNVQRQPQTSGPRSHCGRPLVRFNRRALANRRPTTGPAAARRTRQMPRPAPAFAPARLQSVTRPISDVTRFWLSVIIS